MANKTFAAEISRAAGPLFSVPPGEVPKLDFDDPADKLGAERDIPRRLMSQCRCSTAYVCEAPLVTGLAEKQEEGDIRERGNTSALQRSQAGGPGSHKRALWAMMAEDGAKERRIGRCCLSELQRCTSLKEDVLGLYN